jgi:predicted dehydrogenase
MAGLKAAASKHDFMSHKLETEVQAPIQKRVIRLAYVGCGFMAQNVHLPNFSSLNDCKLVALAENRVELARKVAQRFSVAKIYDDHCQLLGDSEIDAVGLSADYAQQGEIAADLLRVGKHVFMEKPMAVSVQQAERILRAAEEGNSRLMIGYMKRYDPGNRLVRQVVRKWREEPSKGKLLFARSHGFCGNWLAELDMTRMIQTEEPIKPRSHDELLPAWLPVEYRESYIAYLQQYTHNVNLLRFLLDVGRREEIVIRRVDLDRDGYTGIVALQLGDVRCVIESGRTKFHSWEEHTQVYFEGGWIHTWPKGLFAQPQYSHVEIYEGGETGNYQYPVPKASAVWHYREEAAHFLSSLKSGAPFESSGEDALLDVWTFEEIYKKHIGIAA